MTTRTTTVATGLAAALLLLAGCADGDDDPTVSTSPSASASSASASPSPSASESASASPSPSASASPSTGAFSLEDVSSADFPDLGPDLGTTGAVRVGRHTGYDRVVWQFDGPDTPNFQVRYVDEPRGDGSGDPVEVKGEAYLEVVVTSLGIPGSPDDCPDAVPGSKLSGTVFAEAGAFCGGFEGMGQAFVGLDEERPFRVAVLENPSRLVVDVRTG